MKWIATLVLIALMNIAIFGVAVVQHGANHDMNAPKSDCVAATITNTKCPDTKDSLGIAVHHMNAFQVFSQGLVSSGVTTSLILLVIALSAALGLVFVKILDLLRNLALQHQRFRYSRDYTPPRQHKLIRWLSLFELSPAYAGSA